MTGILAGLRDSGREGQGATPLGISSVAFACIVGATLVGLFLHDILPKDHLSDASKDAVKLGMGIAGAIAQLARSRGAARGQGPCIFTRQSK